MLKELILKLWSKERSDTPFLIFISFTLSLLVARSWVILTGAYKLQTLGKNPIMIGPVLVIGGFHIHHITYGVLLLAIAGLMAIYYKDKKFMNISAIFYGAGLGLIIDELGFIVEGLSTYHPDNLLPKYIIFILILGIIGALVYFPSFKKGIKMNKIKIRI